MASQLYTDGVTLTAAAEFNLFDSAVYNTLSSVTGTNTLAATGPTSYTTYASTGPLFKFIPGFANTSTVTLNVSGLGAKNVFWNGAACVGGELKASSPVVVFYDGTQFNIVGNGIVAATQAQQETATSASAAVTPSTQQFHPSALKAEVRFNSAGTIAYNYNITSITDTGVGNWEINIGTDFSGAANYAGIAMSGFLGPALNRASIMVVDTASEAGIFHVGCFDGTDGVTRRDPDTPDEVHVLFAGDQ